MNKLTVFLVPFSLTATTALAGGYVAPVISYEPAVIAKPETKKPFQWTGPYAGISLGHTEIDLKRKVETETPTEEIINHPAVTEVVEIPHEAVTTEVDVPAETETILHPAETETILHPPVIGEREVTVTTPGGEITVPKFVPHDPEYGTETVTVGKLIATEDAELPEGYKLGAEAGGDSPGYYYVQKANDEYAFGEADKEGFKLSTYQPTYTFEKTVITKPGYVEETTETITTPPGSYTYTETFIKEPARVETKVVKDAWEETKVVKPAGTETVVVKPGYIEKRVVEVKPAWTEVVKTAYTSTLFQELKDTANTYGVFGGYRYQFKNNVVIGAEANFTKTEQVSATFNNETYNFNLNTVSLEAQVGYAYKRFLPYAALGIASTDGDKGWLAAVGVDYAVTDNIVIGAKYTHYEYNDIQKWEADVDNVSIRAAFKF